MIKKSYKLTDNQLERFLYYIEKTSSCWIWTGDKTVSGYGSFHVYKNKVHIKYGAHRLSWALHHNQNPGKFFICHRCDNPICVNPEHLFAGTQQDNVNDMLSKGRGIMQRDPDRLKNFLKLHSNRRARGDAHPGTKLTTVDVENIRALFEFGVPAKTLAKDFGVSKNTIWRVANGTTWGHISKGLSYAT